MARPSDYTEETAERICDMLAQGTSLRKVCMSDGMPDRRTVMRWLDANEGFATKYARARDIGLDERADAMREEIQTEEDIGRARLMLDYGKWYLSKLAPKKYGERLDVEHSGGITVKLESDASDL